MSKFKEILMSEEHKSWSMTFEGLIEPVKDINIKGTLIFKKKGVAKFKTEKGILRFEIDENEEAYKDLEIGQEFELKLHF